MADDYLNWIGTPKTIKTDGNYRDATPTPPLVITPNSDLMEKAQTSAEQLETKMFGHDVRAALAQWVLLGGYLYQQNIITLQQYAAALDSFKKDVVNRQTAVEQRQTAVESDFKKVVANATVDSEVILARSSERYGSFSVIDDRLEYIESLLGTYVPVGFDVTIVHGQGRNPTTVTVKYYENAIGTEANGFGSAGTFGGTASTIVPTKVEFSDTNTLIIHLPIDYKLLGTPVYKYGCWYLTDGYRTLKFDLGKVDDTAASSGSSQGG